MYIKFMGLSPYLNIYLRQETTDEVQSSPFMEENIKYQVIIAFSKIQQPLKIEFSFVCIIALHQVPYV